MRRNATAPLTRATPAAVAVAGGTGGVSLGSGGLSSGSARGVESSAYSKPSEQAELLPVSSVAVARKVVVELSTTETWRPVDSKSSEAPVAARFGSVQSEALGAA
jgi:hypothetical protein